jgi:hypothetical protein
VRGGGDERENERERERRGGRDEKHDGEIAGLAALPHSPILADSRMHFPALTLPPPKGVWKPKQKTRSEVVLYAVASFSRMSFLDRLASPGWITSTT